MKIAVKDACVLIDLEAMGVLDLYFLLGLETLTTDLVVEELRNQHPDILTYIDSGNLQVQRVPLPELVLLLDEVAAEGLSDADASVLHVAEQADAMLLTCDGKLREVAAERWIEVHGSIWVLDELVKVGHQKGAIAAAKLEYLMSLEGAQARFISPKLADPYLRKWRKGA